MVDFADVKRGLGIAESNDAEMMAAFMEHLRPVVAHELFKLADLGKLRRLLDDCRPIEPQRSLAELVAISDPRD